MFLLIHYTMITAYTAAISLIFYCTILNDKKWVKYSDFSKSTQVVTWRSVNTNSADIKMKHFSTMILQRIKSWWKLDKLLPLQNTVWANRKTSTAEAQHSKWLLRTFKKQGEIKFQQGTQLKFETSTTNKTVSAAHLPGNIKHDRDMACCSSLLC